MNTSEKNYRDERETDINSIDSEVNTSDAQQANHGESLTNDESAGADPDQADDKPSFTRDQQQQNDRTRFDGNINI